MFKLSKIFSNRVPRLHQQWRQLNPWIIKLNSQQTRGKISGKISFMEMGDYLAVSDGTKVDLFKSKGFKLTLKEGFIEWSTDVKWCPSKQCSICKDIFEAEAHIDKCTKCQVEVR